MAKAPNTAISVWHSTSLAATNTLHTIWAGKLIARGLPGVVQRFEQHFTILVAQLALNLSLPNQTGIPL